MSENNREIMLQVENLHKRYGRFMAVDGISFEVFQGEVLGFLGPNGAGKSTTIDLITTLQQPTAGRVTYSWLAGTLQPQKIR
jgi:ABC-2 type transport system ATP-binding protein